MYNTKYSNLSDSEVNELYRTEIWHKLLFIERFYALQELENRTAKALGNKPCKVLLKSLDGGVMVIFLITKLRSIAT